MKADSENLFQDELLAWHCTTLDDARKLFKAQTSTLQESLRENALATLEDLFAKHLAQLQHLNAQRIRERLETLLESHVVPIEQVLEYLY